MCSIQEIFIHVITQEIIVNFTQMAFSFTDIGLWMEHLSVTSRVYLLAGFRGLFPHICFSEHVRINIKPKHHLHIKINIRSTWYPLSSIWGEKWNMGQWLSFSIYRRFRHPSNLTDWKNKDNLSEKALKKRLISLFLKINIEENVMVFFHLWVLRSSGVK